MKPITQNVLAVIAALFVGCLVNIGFVNAGPFVIPLPEGSDVSTTEGLRDSMMAFKPENFLFPFLGHALGTLGGAFIVARLVACCPMKCAIGIGAFFLIGGITMVGLVGGPIWFCVTDLSLAYIPMGYLGGILARGKQSSTS